jgi:small-conductance mechanosensitive channel/CRP-like cAMP-binding protein
MRDLLETLAGVWTSGALTLLAVVSAVLLLVLQRTSGNPHVRRRSIIAVVLFAGFVLLRLLLLALDPTVTSARGEDVPNPPYQILDVLSYVLFAWAAIQAALLLLVEYLLIARLRMEIPHILSDVLLIAVLLLSILAIFYYKTELDITGVFTTAGVLSIVIGLALQDTLGNVFAGLALQTERPYRVGDWIAFGAYEGVVTDVSWRSTQFRTRSNDIVTVPNSTLSKEVFVNYSSPSRVSARLVDIGVHYRHPPAEVKRVLLAACREVEGVLDRPAPLVRLKTFGDFSITYEVKFWIRDFPAVQDIEEAYRTVVWYAFRREGIEIPYPIQVEYGADLPPEDGAEQAGRVLEQLRGVEFFSPLSESELRTLAERTKLHEYYQNETICRQDDEGDSLFVLEQGTVVVTVSKNGRQEEVARLEPPHFFGEMALCTGEKRTATVRAATPVRLLVVDADDFRSIILANPDLAAKISDILARRQVELLAKREALDRSLAAAHADASRQILHRIRNFFFKGTSQGA